MKNRGITLIELLVVLAILTLVLAAIYQAYLSVLRSYVRETTTSISNIDKLIGAEIIRRDIELAGFGIPNDEVPIEWDEGTDKLTIRSTIASRNDYTKCYGYVDYSGIRLFTLDSGEISVADCNDTDICYLAVDLDYNKKNDCYTTNSAPPSELLLLFGVNSTDHEIIYELKEYNSQNRPSRCALSTKALQREDPSTGAQQPILDCVKEFKVAFGVDTNNDNAIDSWSDTLPSDSKNIRSQVKQLLIFIIYHEGTKDNNFNYSGGTIYLKTPSQTIGSFNPSGDDIHYRWKLFQFSVKPMNLKREVR